MAGQGLQNTSSTGTGSFDKDLKKDVNDIGLPPNSWTQARNAINSSKTGDLGKLGNEPANNLCTIATYKIIGTIHLTANFWAIFSTDEINSEIGIFQEGLCLYTPAVNDPCLKFSKYHLIKGVSRSTSTCTYKLYWDDGNNPSRAMEVTIDKPSDNSFLNSNSPIPWIQLCTNVNNCQICTNTSQLDCDKIRLARFITTPCVEVLRGSSAGTLLNGSYFVAIAYAIKGQKISDWYVSNIQSVFSHDNSASSIDVNINALDTTFDEIQVAIIYIVNQQTVARLAGIYSTHQKKLSFDTIDLSWPTIPIEEIPLMNPVDDRTDSMYTVNDYLIRTGPTSKEDFNFQPLANQIVTKWVSVEYPGDYYRKGGNKTNYLRDEVYAFFIRWVFDTGDKSSSYHIPGRPSFPSDLTVIGNADSEPETQATPPLTPFNWVVYNTATVTSLTTTTLPDGGVQIGEGFMGYWESTEQYPDDKPQIWNANILTTPYPGTTSNQYDICGQPIRHHRFPENHIFTGGSNLSPDVCNYTDAVGDRIRIMGVKFENIQAPLMNDGVTPVSGIVGYEILRGSRNGNKTVLSKGIINNMRLYNIEGGVTTRTGAFANYPYNDLRPDKFLSTTETKSNVCSPFSGGGLAEDSSSYNASSNYSQLIFSFHSPDTNFTHPYLANKEIKVYGEINGDVTGKFEISEKHPKEKLITNTAFLISAIAGIGISSIAANGARTTTYHPPRYPGVSQDPIFPTWAVAGGTGGTIPTPVPFFSGAQPGDFGILSVDALQIAADLGYPIYQALLESGLGLADNLTGLSANDNIGAYTGARDAFNTSLVGADIFGVASTSVPEESWQDGDFQRIPGVLRVIAGIPLFFNYFTEGTDSVLRLIKAIVRYRDFVLRYHSHCLYNRYLSPVVGNSRRVLDSQQYIGPQITDFDNGIRINNLYRSEYVALSLLGPSGGGSLLADPSVNDITRILASDVTPFNEPDIFGNPRVVNPTKFAFGPISGFQPSITPGNAGAFYSGHSGIQIASSHYVGLKQRIQNLYGQINGVMQVPASYCTLPVSTCVDSSGVVHTGVPACSGVVFGGDTYVGRYTEKNTMFFFYDWLYNQPDGAQLNYKSQRMLPWPRFWANFDNFETSDFTSSVLQNIMSLPSITGWILPNTFYNLDGLFCPPGIGAITNIRLSIRDAWMYLFNSGVRDFYVESEINVDLRDWGLTDTEQFYDPYRFTDTKAMFDTAIIKAGNYYKYDQSLSISKLFINYVSWAAAQDREYNPFIAETCFVYSPNKVIYSLPSQFEGKRDNWLIFLANNYHNFLSKVTSIKSVNKSGALIFFENLSPVEFQGVDQLQTTGGTKLTIGDGGLFSQPLQNVVNADRPYEYGSCQDRLSVINTPMGVFWISQNQGKIFNLQGNLEEISMMDLKWWFLQYLPYKLTQQFPTFSLTDNPVSGIGCQSIFDNENQLVYFTKRDFIVRTDIPDIITYVSNDQFLVNGLLPITLGDPNYFEDASWTVSYDPKTKGWISYHDWHPNLLMPGKNTFMSILDDGVWIHNQRCDSYCNYYNKDYPFEVEYMVNTIQQVNTLRSIEYIMEAYKYAPNCYDRFHELDFNFDECVIYNTEQVSGLLKLNLQPRQQPFQQLLYPIVNFNNIDVLYSKVENKYRLNQFWDITDDRGEYNPAAQRVIWNTGANGYVRVLNPNNLNYAKDPFQRKKFRHYTNSVFLRRRVSGDKKMLVMLANNKDLNSPR